jgi:hypothetical protein
MRDFNLIKRKLYPEGVVLGFSDTAKRGRDAVRTRTRKIFKLHSDYIPRGVMHLPDRSKPNSIKASIKGLVGKYRDFEASVFLRGSHNPQGDLGFMLFHETGKDKTSQDGPGKIAIPRSGVVNANSKTSKGRRRKRFKPEKMLEYYNTRGEEDLPLNRFSLPAAGAHTLSNATFWPLQILKINSFFFTVL